MNERFESLRAQLKEQFDEDVAAVQSFLRQKSISYTNEGIRETAQLLVAFIEEAGGEARLAETPGYPVVTGYIDAGKPKTLLIYGMYDTMPADEPGWISDPFAAEIVDLPDFGPSVVARGAANTKGPLRGFFNVLRAYREAGMELPCNLMFAVEGEEEYGSRHFPLFVNEHLDELRKADGAFFPFFSQGKDGEVELWLGMKGILYMELTARGGDWGGPTERGIHGAYNVVIANPAWRLVNALATLSDAEEHIQVEGFFDDIVDTTESDRELARKLAETDAAKRLLEANDVRRFKYDLSGEDLWLELFNKPQLNIDGIWGGYTGPGTKTLTPHEVTAKIDVRMVKNMTPEKTFQRIRDHLDKHGFEDVELTKIHGYPPSKVSPNHPMVKCLVETLQELGQDPLLWPTVSGSAPFYVFDDVLEMPVVTGGLGHGARQHSSNEYLTVAGLLEFEKSCALFMEKWAKADE